MNPATSLADSDRLHVSSKVLVVEDDETALTRLKEFFDGHHIRPVRPQTDRLESVLRSNVDLGAIVIREDLCNDQGSGIELGRRIHELRPELPIFLRSEHEGRHGLAAADWEIFRGVFSIGQLDDLAEMLSNFVFNMAYPNALLRGIKEMTEKSLESQFRDVKVRIETPYVVRDKFLHGEIFTLIPIETRWCRGYMSLQVEEAELTRFAQVGLTHLSPSNETGFREVNAVLGELTNLIWGAFKNRYGGSVPEAGYVAQVPIIVNHLHRYISFGSDQPHLCFRCLVTSNARPDISLVLIQRFAFNLSWSPEDFRENIESVDNLVASGELEFF